MVSNFSNWVQFWRSCTNNFVQFWSLFAVSWLTGKVSPCRICDEHFWREFLCCLQFLSPLDGWDFALKPFLPIKLHYVVWIFSRKCSRLMSIRKTKRRKITSLSADNVNCYIWQRKKTPNQVLKPDMWKSQLGKFLISCGCATHSHYFLKLVWIFHGRFNKYKWSLPLVWFGPAC